MQKLLAIISSVLVFRSASSSTCSFPPEYWCGSEEIATSCGVSAQCRPWLDKPKDAAFVSRDHAGEEKRRLLDLTVLYEVLCPDCQEFLIDQVALAISELGAEFWTHVKLTLYPYGNAEESFDAKSDRYVFRCQHGPAECLGNQIHACAMNSCGNDARKWFPFVHCMELKSRDAAAKKQRKLAPPEESLSISEDDIKKFGKECASAAKFNWTEILECTTSWRGNLIQHAIAKATPKHQYVPWVIVHGRHTERIQNDAEKNLLKLICRFMHHPKPFACYKHSTNDVGSRSYVKTLLNNS